MAEDKKKQLLDFIDKKAFDVVINANPDKYDKDDRKKLEDIQRKTRNEKEQFHKDYKNAKEVKDGFLSDVRSDAAQKVDKELRHLHLPTLPEIKDDFMKLCDKIGV
ncbi:MAG: hypothetical protein ACTHK8_00480 [Ginsengibacter sp.]